MILRPFTLLSFVAFLGAGLHVYQTKHEAALLDQELRSIARQVREAEARAQTLHAEWAWLNEPQRLRAVAQRHLPELEAMQPAQFIRASEAERRLPAVAAYTGPTALFAAREAAPPDAATVFALVPRIADAVQVAAAPADAPPVVVAPALAPVLAPVAAPVVVADAVPVVEAEPAATAAPPPAIRLALPAAPPAAPPSGTEVRVTETRTRPAPAEPIRATQPRPASRVTTEVASLPPVATSVPRQVPNPTVTRVAATVAPRPAIAPPQGFAAQSFAGGSALGGGRPMLAPPVPFGSAGAATLGGGTPR